MDIGVIADTHGSCDHWVAEAFRNVASIVHAGDIDTPDVLESLHRIAPVHAVRGNMDRGDWARDLPKTDILEIGAITIYLVHDLAGIDLEPGPAGVDVVVYGHSHRPETYRREGVLYLNPGSAGWPRHGFSASAAILKIRGNSLNAHFVGEDDSPEQAP